MFFKFSIRQGEFTGLLNLFALIWRVIFESFNFQSRFLFVAEVFRCRVRLNDRILMIRWERSFQFNITNNDLIIFNPGGSKFKIFFIIEELKSFINTERLQRLILLLLLSFLERKICNLFAESILISNWNVGMYCKNEGSISCID